MPLLQPLRTTIIVIITTTTTITHHRHHHPPPPSSPSPSHPQTSLAPSARRLSLHLTPTPRPRTAAQLRCHPARRVMCVAACDVCCSAPMRRCRATMACAGRHQSDHQWHHRHQPRRHGGRRLGCSRSGRGNRAAAAQRVPAARAMQSAAEMTARWRMKMGAVV